MYAPELANTGTALRLLSVPVNLLDDLWFTRTCIVSGRSVTCQINASYAYWALCFKSCSVP